MKIQRNKNPRLGVYARRMRSAQTIAERKLWSLLRGRQLGNYKFRRQHPVEGYILDFYCASHRLAIELDGGQHSDPEALKYDQRRAKLLGRLGIRVLRFWDNDMLNASEAVASEILRHLDARPSPQPSPAVAGEGVPAAEGV